MGRVRDLLPLLAGLGECVTPAARTAAWNLAWMLGGTAVSQGCLIVAVIILTGALGREPFGILATALALQNYVVVVGSAGLPVVLVREFVRRPGEQSKIVSTFVVMAWALGTVSATAAVLIAWLLGVSSDELRVLAVLAIGATPACANPIAVYDALHRQAVASVVIALADLILLAIVLAGWYGEYLSVLGVAFVFAAKWFMAVMALTLMMRRWVRFSLNEVRWNEAIRLWRSGWPILVASILATLPISGGTIIVRWLHGPAEAGIMGLAAQVLQAVLTIGSLAHRLVSPHVNGPYGFDRRFVLKLLVFYALFLSLVYISLLGGTAVLVRYVLDPAYSSALWPCWLSATAGVIAIGGTTGNNYLLAMHRERWISVSFFGAAVVFTLTSAVLTGPFAASGQAAATVIAYAALSVLNALGLVLGHSTKNSNPSA